MIVSLAVRNSKHLHAGELDFSGEGWPGPGLVRPTFCGRSGVSTVVDHVADLTCPVCKRHFDQFERREANGPTAKQPADARGVYAALS